MGGDRIPEKSAANLTQRSSATMKELKEIESCNVPTASLLSSSADKIARTLEQERGRDKEDQDPDQGKGNWTRYLMKRASPVTISPPATGKGTWTRYLMKRAGPETTSPSAMGKGIQSCYL